MKTKGEPIGFATNAGKPEARRGYTPVVTGSMRNRVRAQGIEAPRGADGGGSEAWRGSWGTHIPRCFCKRVRKLLKTKDGSRKKERKEKSRVRKRKEVKEIEEVKEVESENPARFVRDNTRNATIDGVRLSIVNCKCKQMNGLRPIWCLGWVGIAEKRARRVAVGVTCCYKSGQAVFTR